MCGVSLGSDSICGPNLMNFYKTLDVKFCKALLSSFKCSINPAVCDEAAALAAILYVASSWWRTLRTADLKPVP